MVDIIVGICYIMCINYKGEYVMNNDVQQKLNHYCIKNNYTIIKNMYNTRYYFRAVVKHNVTNKTYRVFYYTCNFKSFWKHA